MQLQKRIEDFVILGEFLSQFKTEETEQNSSPLNKIFYNDFKQLLQQVTKENLWFTTESVHTAITGICEMLHLQKMQKWLQNYHIAPSNTQITVAVIMAGNIPMVGFHDMLCVLLAGHRFIGKLSSKDNQLLDFIAKLLIAINPQWETRIAFTNDSLGSSQKFDAIIATGSNNSARYFDAYFSKYPNIIRRNRNSIAVLSGNETEQQLQDLGNDVFQYFGLGCRNVSKLYLPKDYNIAHLLDQWQSFENIINHSKYANNYNYQRSVFLMNNTPHFDNGFVLLQENLQLSSPIGVLNYEFYSDTTSLEKQLQQQTENIQCIVGNDTTKYIPFGKAQQPEVWDYADGIDTMQFLTQLH